MPDALETLQRKLRNDKVRLPLGATILDLDADNDELLALAASYAEDPELLALAAKAPGPCSLDRHPGKSNWVEDAGGLPNYICQIARAIHRKGRSISQSIAIAVGTVKRWSVDPTKSASVRARAKAAVAEWARKRASAHAKHAAKSAAS